MFNANGSSRLIGGDIKWRPLRRGRFFFTDGGMTCLLH